MKLDKNIKEHNNVEDESTKKIEHNNQSECVDYDDSDILIKKITKNKKTTKQSQFRNNYKHYQYDYEEDFYEPNKY